MKAELVNLNSMLLGGMGFYGDPFQTKGGWESDNEIGRTFTRFIQHLTANPKREYSLNKDFIYEVHIYDESTPSRGCFEVFVGEEIKSHEIPSTLCMKYIREAEYLKVTLFGAEITRDWVHQLDKDIIPSLGIRRKSDHIIQVYDERFKGMDQIEASILDVYLPIERIGS